MSKTEDKGETTFVRKFARALAVANGHSHPDEYADKVAAAYVAPPEPAESDEDDDQDDEGAPGGEG